MAQQSHLNGAQQTKTLTQAFINVMALRFALDTSILLRWLSNKRQKLNGTVVLASFVMYSRVSGGKHKKHEVDAFTAQTSMQVQFEHDSQLSEETLKYAGLLASDLP